MSASAVIVIALLAFAVAAVAWQARALRHASEQVQRIVQEPGPVPAAPDNERGVRLDWADECARILSLGVYGPRDPELEAGCDRLLEAIRDEQTKGEK